MNKLPCLIGIMSALLFTGCAGNDWLVIKDVKQIAEYRNEVNKGNLNFSDVLIIRMRDENNKRIEVTSIAPSIIGQQKGGAPAAKSTLAITPKRDALILYTQDVPNWQAFRKVISVTEILPGKTFRFPVVQESGEVREQTFTFEQTIVR